MSASPRTLDRNARANRTSKRRFTVDPASCVTTGDLERVGYGVDADGIGHVVFETGAKQQTGIPADVIAEVITGGKVYPLAQVVSALVAEHGKSKLDKLVADAHAALAKD